MRKTSDDFDNEVAKLHHEIVNTIKQILSDHSLSELDVYSAGLAIWDPYAETDSRKMFVKGIGEEGVRVEDFEDVIEWNDLWNMGELSDILQHLEEVFSEPK